MARHDKKRPGAGGSPTGSKENHPDRDGNPYSEKLAVGQAWKPPEGVTQKVDKELDSDRTYFKRWPERKHRVRRIFPNERALLLDQARFFESKSLPPDPLTHAI